MTPAVQIASVDTVHPEPLQHIQHIISTYGTAPSDLIPILQHIQHECRYLSEEALHAVADALHMPVATVYGVATFYAQFSLTPKGKWVVRLCDGTACHVRGSKSIFEAIRKKLNLLQGETSTDDGLFTVEVLSCVGACGLAPVVSIGDKMHGQLTAEAMNIILDELIKQEEQDAHNEQRATVAATEVG